MGAVVLGAQSVIVFLGALVARALGASTGNASSSAYLLVGSGLAVACILVAGLMRRPFGVTLGWLVQVATFLCAFVLPMMLIVGVIFTVLWVICLWQGQRIDAIQAGRAAEAGL
jgi:high-affinity Fe2+/Pb2+ permease